MDEGVPSHWQRRPAGNQLPVLITRTQLDRERITPDGDGWSKGRGIGKQDDRRNLGEPETSHCSVNFRVRKQEDRKKRARPRDSHNASHLKSKLNKFISAMHPSSETMLLRKPVEV